MCEDVVQECQEGGATVAPPLVLSGGDHEFKFTSDVYRGGEVTVCWICPGVCTVLGIIVETGFQSGYGGGGG